MSVGWQPAAASAITRLRTARPNWAGDVARLDDPAADVAADLAADEDHLTRA
jgi:hypothetical protein